MKRIIILDFCNGNVVTIAAPTDPKEAETSVRKWCEKNSVKFDDCLWMGWNGVIKIEEAFQSAFVTL